ncbi:MAG: flippase-like domain-containing protein [Bdellovibrionales bacterium]|nr:flippase-like domain-containing protein [Bdellovibrionales bacterium]
MASKVSNKLSLILKVTIAVLLIGYLVKSGHLDPKDLWELMTLPNIVIALLIIGANIFMAAWRWIVLLRARGFTVPLFYGWSLYMIGIFFNHALPGAVGGDLVRGYYLVNDHPERRMDAVMSVLIDRVLGLYSFFILTLVAVAFDFDFVMGHEQIRWVALMCFMVFTGMTLFFLIVFSHRLSEMFGLKFFEKRIPIVHKMVVSLQYFGANRMVIVYSVGISLVAQMIGMLFFYAMAQMSGEAGVTWNAIMFAVPMGFLVTAVPIAPAGIGVGQVAFLYLFQAYLQRPTQFGATAITAFQLATACWALVGAVFYLRRRKPHDVANMEAMAEAAE